MAIVVVQSRSLTGAEPTILAYSSSVTIGSLLFAAVFWAGSTATCSVSDDKNGAWTALGSPQTGLEDEANNRLQFFYKQNAAAGTTTVTADVSSAGTCGLAIHEASGIDQVALDANVGYVARVNTDPADSPGITNVSSDALLFSAAVLGTAVGSVNAPFAIQQSANWGSNATATTIVASVGTRNATFSSTGGVQDWILGIVSFRGTQPSVPSDNPPIGLLGMSAGW